MTKLVRLWVLLLLSALALGGRAQTPAPLRTCATPLAAAQQQTALKQRLPGYDPAALPRQPAKAPRLTTAEVYTLPVVVHVVHDGEAVGTGSNLSQAQIQSQLDVLNEDYGRQNADSGRVPSVFWSLRAAMPVRFRLADFDPRGQPLAEPGIDRIDRRARTWTPPPYGRPTELSYLEDTIKPQSSWDPDKYLNIWVLPLGRGLLGYAQLPDNTAALGGLSAQGGRPETDGLVIASDVFGRVGALRTGFDRGRTTTHEMGHFLGLLHLWGDANCGTDYVADTPTQQAGNFGCPAFPHVSCANGPSGDLFMNFLDYAADACMQLFTPGQAERVRAVLAAGTPRRTSLATSAALVAQADTRAALPITAFPVPFGANGLSLRVRATTTGPLVVQLVDVLGRCCYAHTNASVAVGTSIVFLAGTEQLAPGIYFIQAQQGAQTTRLRVVRQ